MVTAGKPDDAVLFAGVSLKLGTVCRHLLCGTRVPYTIALLILGVALGSLGANINPDLLLAAFLPALLFESAFSMDAHQIKFTFPYDWNLEISLLLGGLLSATDPVAVVAHLKELGTSKKAQHNY
ncbi:hypothetical protein ACQ4PT_050537 [Festuca glaucescens]